MAAAAAAAAAATTHSSHCCSNRSANNSYNYTRCHMKKNEIQIYYLPIHPTLHP